MKNNRKAVEERHRRILDRIRTCGEVKVEELAREFGVSAMTARRDLQYMEQKGLLARTHGGAVSLERTNTMLSRNEKITLCRDRISEYAAGLVHDGDRLFINGSLTALNLLKYLGEKKASVFTNNCRAIGERYPEQVTVRLTGGELRGPVMVGDYVMRNLLDMTADKTFLGCAAIYDDGEFRYDIPTEIGINESMIARTTKEIYILADHTKIQNREAQTNVYGSCFYGRPCTLITDDNASPGAVERLRRRGTQVSVVPTNQEIRMRGLKR